MSEIQTESTILDSPIYAKFVRKAWVSSKPLLSYVMGW